MKVFIVLTDCLNTGLGSESSPFKIEVNSEHIPKVGDYVYLDWSVLSKPTKDCDDMDLEDLLEFYEGILKEIWYVTVDAVTFNYLADAIYIEVEVTNFR